MCHHSSTAVYSSTLKFKLERKLPNLQLQYVPRFPFYTWVYDLQNHRAQSSFFVLLAKWKVSKVQLFPLQTVPGTPNDLDRDPVKVIFALVAESLAGIKVDEAKLKIRQVLADAHLPALFGTPFQWTSDSISSSTTDGMSLNFVESFTITYYTIIGFATIEERNTAVEVMRKLWAFILRKYLFLSEFMGRKLLHHWKCNSLYGAAKGSLLDHTTQASHKKKISRKIFQKIFPEIFLARPFSRDWENSVMKGQTRLRSVLL